MRSLVLGMVIAVAACGGSGAGSDGHSGTRLKLRRLVFDGGTSVIQGVHDAQLDVDCDATKWTDGKQYCTPSGLTIHYSDPQCTTRIASADNGPCYGAASDYVWDVSYGTCGGSSGVSHLYRRGAAMSLAQFYELATDGTCSGPIQSTGLTLYAVGAEVPASQLVEMTEAMPTGTGPISVRSLVSADGLEMPVGLHDNTNDVDCGPYTAIGLDQSCRPDDVLYAEVYSDAQCSTVVAADSQSCPSTTKYVQLPPATTCPNGPTPVALVGPAIATPAMVYARNGSACAASNVPPDTIYYSIGAPVSLPKLTREVGTGKGRIENIRLANGNVHLATPELRDTMLDVDCFTFTSDHGATWHCYPDAGFVQAMFSDAGCTQALDVIAVYVGDATCPAAVLPKVAVKFVPPPTGQCTDGIVTYHVGAAYTGALYTGSSTSCQALPPDPTTAYYVTGTEIPAADIAQAMLVTDP